MLVAGSTIFEYAHRVPTGLSETFGIFADPENLERLTPRWMQFRMAETPRQLEAGMLIRYRIAPFGLAMEWAVHFLIPSGRMHPSSRPANFSTT